MQFDLSNDLEKGVSASEKDKVQSYEAERASLGPRWNTHNREINYGRRAVVAQPVMPVKVARGQLTSAPHVPPWKLAIYDNVCTLPPHSIFSLK